MYGDNRKYLVTNDNQQILVYNEGYYKTNGKPILEERINFWLDEYFTDHRKREVISYCKSIGYVERDQLKPPEHLINLKNGIYNRETKKIIPHSPEYVFLYQIPVKYNKKAKCSKILKFFTNTLNIEDIPLDARVFW